MFRVVRGVDEHGVIHLVEINDDELVVFASKTAAHSVNSSILLCLNYMRWIIPIRWVPDTTTPTCLRCVCRMLSSTVMRRRPDGAIMCVWNEARSP